MADTARSSWDAQNSARRTVSAITVCPYTLSAKWAGMSVQPSAARASHFSG